MIRAELLSMRQLKATNKMLAVAREDVPKKVHVGYYYVLKRKYDLFMRCRVENGILKAALYNPDAMRTGGRLPSYEVFIEADTRKFITYDPVNRKWLKAKLDRLIWSDRMLWNPAVWVSAADSKLVSSYLGTKEGGYAGILSFQKEIRKEELRLRHKRETDPWDADLALTPDLPKDWNRWVTKVGIPENFIFYRYDRQGTKQGYCSYCEKDVPLRVKPRHNQEGVCPRCRRKITYKAIGRLGWRLETKEVSVYLIQARPDGVVVREFWATRSYLYKDIKNPKVSCVEHWRVIYNLEMEARTYFWGTYKQQDVRWIAGAPTGSWMGYNSNYYYHGCQDGRVYGKTLPHLAKGLLRRTGLVDWIKANNMTANPDSYLMLYKKLPQFEQIWKSGLTELQEECWNDYHCMDGLIKNPESTGLARALGIDKQGLSRLRRYDGGRLLLQWLQWEKETGKLISDEALEWFGAQEIKVSDLSFILEKMNPLQIYHYMRRQAEESHESIRQVLTTWQDYLSMAERLGIDTNDEIVYRAKLLRQRHDELVMRSKRGDHKEQAEEVLKDFPDVDRICQSIKEKYEYANDQYAIVVPRGALDIIVEGDMLSHCVGSHERYWERIEQQESFVLFLRRASMPHIPYYTLEIEPDGTVRQKRTKFDRQEADIEDAVKFLAEWQQVVAKRLTAGDRKKAADSRVLREQEFEQMRRDNVIIHAGDLAGQRLVDVLMADLMESAA